MKDCRQLPGSGEDWDRQSRSTVLQLAQCFTSWTHETLRVRITSWWRVHITEHCDVVVWARRTDTQACVSSTRHVKCCVAASSSALKTSTAATPTTDHTQQLPPSSSDFLHIDHRLTHWLTTKLHLRDPQSTRDMSPATVVSRLHSSTVSTIGTETTVNWTWWRQSTATARPRTSRHSRHTVTHLNNHTIQQSTGRDGDRVQRRHAHGPAGTLGTP